MKQEKFNTSKGSFLVVDLPIDTHFQNNTEYLVTESTKDMFLLPVGRYLSINSLKNITEEQASEIVDEPFGLEVGDDEVIVFKDYEDEENTYSNSIDSLYSLIFSKGIHLFKNPYKYTKTENEEIADKMSMCRYITKEESKSFIEEEKTFYNPYIFKIVN